MIQVFLSHSASDAALAQSVADFLRAALNLAAGEIRCTSVPGYKLPGGAHTEEQLRREVRESGVLVGLLSAASLESLYVAFELGARWVPRSRSSRCSHRASTWGRSAVR